MADNRNRYFASIVYPESAKENWKDILKDQHVRALISPLHDKDMVDKDTGEIKKPHYHVMLLFTALKSKRQAKEIFDLIGGVGCISVNSAPVYARYLCHLDENPLEKHIYEKSEVEEIGGADYFDLIEMNSDRYLIIQEMVDFCRENEIFSYARLFDYARYNETRWFRCLCDSATYVIKEYLKSRKWENDVKVLEQNSNNSRNLSLANSTVKESTNIE